MPHILLLGAGFSRNWGGWLAREIGDALLQRVAGDQYLRDILNRSSAFEDALSILQGEAASSAQGKDRLAKFEDAISYVFDQMNRSYAQLGHLDFGSRHGYSIQVFLARFDAIFTLNQDLLLELSYQIPAGMDWNGYQFPGMVQPEPSAKKWRPSGEFKVRGDAQPIFKLHGSVNWRAQDGSSLLVMGANKTASIRERELFVWYMDAFKFHLSAPGTRLMVIGYSFMDDHINNEIIQAQSRELATFLVDPSGRDALADKRLTGAIIRPYREIEHINLLAISTRGLRGTFGDDALEHEKFDDFFGR